MTPSCGDRMTVSIFMDSILRGSRSVLAVLTEVGS